MTTVRIDLVRQRANQLVRLESEFFHVLERLPHWTLPEALTTRISLGSAAAEASAMLKRQPTARSSASATKPTSAASSAAQVAGIRAYFRELDLPAFEVLSYLAQHHHQAHESVGHLLVHRNAHRLPAHLLTHSLTHSPCRGLSRKPCTFSCKT